MPEHKTRGVTNVTKISAKRHKNPEASGIRRKHKARGTKCQRKNKDSAKAQAVTGGAGLTDSKAQSKEAKQESRSLQGSKVKDARYTFAKNGSRTQTNATKGGAEKGITTGAVHIEKAQQW